MTPKAKKNKINIMTAVQAIHRHIQGKVLEEKAVRIELPFVLHNGNPITLYFIQNEGSKSKKHILMAILDHITEGGVPTNHGTLDTVCHQYDCYLSKTDPDGDIIIVEDTDGSLTERTRNIMQSVIVIDGMIRIRKGIRNERIVPRDEKKASLTDSATGSGKEEARIPRRTAEKLKK